MHIEKVKVEAAAAGRVRTAALVAVGEETQDLEGALYGIGALDPAALDRDRVRRQRETDHRDA